MGSAVSISRPSRCPCGAAAAAGLDGRDRPRLPLARAIVGPSRAVRRNGSTDPPSRVGLRRYHLRVRRADHRAPSPRYPADERPVAAAAGQGQHRARDRAQAGNDRDRDQRRPRPGRRSGGRPLFRRDLDGAGSDSPGGTSTTGSRSSRRWKAQRHALHRGRDSPQPPVGRRRHPARGVCRGHRRRGFREELADPRLDPRPGGRGVGRPDRPRVAAEQPATYTGLLDPIRAFAKANGVKPALFSANSEGPDHLQRRASSTPTWR